MGGTDGFGERAPLFNKKRVDSLTAGVGALLVSAIVVALACAFASCGGSAALEKGGDPDGDPKEAVDGDGGDNKTANATAWISANSPFDVDKFERYIDVQAVAYGAGKFVVGGTGGSLAYSEDNGLTWTAATVNYDQWNDDSAVFSLVYAAGNFIAGGGAGKLLISQDGITWERGQAAGGNPFSSPIKGIAFLNLGNDIANVFVAISSGGIAYAKQSQITDASPWHSIGTTPFNSMRGIAYGDGKLVAVGLQGVTAYSTKGRSDWNEVTNAFGSAYVDSDIYGIVYGKDKFVAVGNKGKIAYSSNGLAPWHLVETTVFGDNHNQINRVTYGGGKFVAVGEQGKIAISTDGTVWEAVKDGDGKSLFPNARDILDVAYGNGKFVAVGKEGTISVSTN